MFFLNTLLGYSLNFTFFSFAISFDEIFQCLILAVWFLQFGIRTQRIRKSVTKKVIFFKRVKVDKGFNSKVKISSRWNAIYLMDSSNNCFLQIPRCKGNWVTFKFSLPKLKTIKTLSFVLKALRSFGHKLEPSAKCSMKD